MTGRVPVAISAIGLALEVIEFSFGAVARVAVPFLDLADELFALSRDLVEVAVGQFAPLRLDFAFHLMPLTLERVSIHRVPPYTASQVQPVGHAFARGSN